MSICLRLSNKVASRRSTRLRECKKRFWAVVSKTCSRRNYGLSRFYRQAGPQKARQGGGIRFELFQADYGCWHHNLCKKRKRPLAANALRNRMAPILKLHKHWFEKWSVAIACANFFSPVAKPRTEFLLSDYLTPLFRILKAFCTSKSQKWTLFCDLICWGKDAFKRKIAYVRYWIVQKSVCCKRIDCSTHP